MNAASLPVLPVALVLVAAVGKDHTLVGMVDMHMEQAVPSEGTAHAHTGGGAVGAGMVAIPHYHQLIPEKK